MGARKLPRLSDHSASLLAGAAVFLFMTVRLIHFYCLPDASLVQVIADDGFYYVRLAQHYAANGFWTFDGSAPATGFHLLYAYLLGAFYSTFGKIDWHHLYLAIGLCSSFCGGLSAYLVARSAAAVLDRRVIPMAICPFFTAPAIAEGTAMMESWMVLLLASLTLFVLTREERPSFRASIGLFAVGLLGSLARSDYGLLPGVLFCSCLLSRRWVGTNPIRRSAMVLLGAVAGVLLVFAHDYAISGKILQSSAEVKLFWSSVEGNGIVLPGYLVAATTFPIRAEFGAAPLVLAFFAGILLALRYVLRLLERAREARNFPALGISLGCLFTILGYLWVYRYNGAALQPWYAANLIAPVGFTLAASVFFLYPRRPLAIASFGLALYIGFGIYCLFETPWPHHAALLRAGLYLKNQETPAIYGSWNAGIIGYFSGRPVVNIDGLVNDDAVPYIKSDKLLDYLKRRRIEYLVDFGVMLADRRFRLRGGYADARTDRCIHPVRQVDGGATEWHDSHVMLYRIQDGCL